MIGWKLDSFVVEHEEDINKKLDEDYLSTNSIVNIETLPNGRLKVYYHKPKDWNIINCFLALPEWVKEKYNVTN